MIHDPVVIFEVLSPSIARVDRVTRNVEYRATASVQRYVMLEQDSQAATVFAREGERWVGSLLTGDTCWQCRRSASRCRLWNCMKGWT